jgi:tetratricopeptide (TPR) repeat protein
MDGWKLRNRRSIAAAIGLLGLLGLFCGLEATARAEPTSEANEAACLRDPECLSHYQSARQLSKAGQSEAALSEYRAAYARLPVPRLLYSIARLQQKLGQPREALGSYRRFLEAASAEDEDLRIKAREYRGELERELPPEPPVTTPALLPVVSSEPPRRPLYKKWWFWTIVGGVVAAGVITGAVVAVRAREPTISPDAQSYSPTF